MSWAEYFKGGAQISAHMLLIALISKYYLLLESLLSLDYGFLDR